eukprot:bmy_09862T0
MMVIERPAPFFLAQPYNSKPPLPQRDDKLRIQSGWLCHLAPEIIRQLSPDTEEDKLPFSKHSDVFALGTIWYELHAREWPFKTQPAEAIIWQMGTGMKPNLSQIGMGKEISDILLFCWAFEQEERPTFTKLMDMLEKLPKRNRRLSHPGHFWKSAEGVSSAVWVLEAAIQGLDPCGYHGCLIACFFLMKVDAPAVTTGQRDSAQLPQLPSHLSSPALPSASSGGQRLTIRGYRPRPAWERCTTEPGSFPAPQTHAFARAGVGTPSQDFMGPAREMRS